MEAAPLRLGMSTSTLWRMMPPGLIETSSRGERFDDRQNDAMCEYIDEMMAALRTSTVQSLECYHMPAWDARRVIGRIKEGLAGCDIEFWSVHAPYGPLYDPSSPDPAIRRAALEACEDAVRVIKDLGARVMVVHPGAHVDAPVSRKERMAYSAGTLAEIAEMAASEGVRVAVEPLPKQEVGNTAGELLAILRAADHPNLGVNLDTNHLFPASCLPLAIREIGDRLVSVHVSDHDGNERHWLPFSGIVDWRGVLETLREIGYSGPLIYETHGFPPPEHQSDLIRMVEENYRRLIGIADC